MPDNSEPKGLIFNIQRYSIHDGPGIRTTVFLKGCPLRCLWCCNPESQIPHPQIMTHDMKCKRCGKCAQVCPVGAITVTKEARTIDRSKCTLCMKCAGVCPYQALSAVGEYKTVAEVLREVESDRVFYENSGGGVTVSGGEPTMQVDFVRALLKACKEKGLHTAMETSGDSPWEALEKVLEYTDLVLYDIKNMDNERHKRATGRSNELILENVRKAGAMGKRIWLRVPLIPGFNDSKENIEKVARLGAEIKAEKVWLLPYHEFGKAKYESLGRKYPFEPTCELTDEYVDNLKQLVESFGVAGGISRS